MKHRITSSLARWVFSLLAFSFFTSLFAQTVTMVCVAPNPAFPGSISPGGPNCNAIIDSARVLGPGTTATAPFTFTVRTYPGGTLIATGTAPLTNVNLFPYLNQIIEIRASDQTNTTLPCASYYRVLDSEAPIITCPATPADVLCSASLDPADLPAITVSDNCFSTLTRSYVDVITGPNCALSPNYVQIARQWTVTDGSGNFSQCTQTINVLQAASADIIFPADYSLDCSSTAADPIVTGRPRVGTRNAGSYCNFSINFTDENLLAPCGTRIINRQWTAINLCNNVVSNGLQVITFIDNQQPNITCPLPQNISTSAGSCLANFTLPAPTVSDNCSSVSVTVNTNTPGGGTAGFSLSNVPVGTYTATYRATDACANFRECTTTITIRDTETPSAICEQVLTVALPHPTGILVMPAAALNRNSTDNCAGIEFQVTRNGTFGPTVTFTCADVGTPVMVTLRVREITNPGSYTDCMNTVTVQDRVAPDITCPAPVTINCNDNFSNLSIYGLPTVVEPCGTTLVADSIFTLSGCGVGSILRRWTARDASGNIDTCSQLITVSNLTPYNGSNIIWPRDTTINNACISRFQLNPDSLPAYYARPLVPNNICAMLFTSYSDQVYDMSSPACYKIIRTWLVWDMCQTQPNGVFTRQQVITLMDNVAPVITHCPADTVVAVSNNCTNGPVNLLSVLATDCSPNITITHNSAFATAQGANASGSYPLGVHRVTFTARDGCGNTSTCSTLITVRDLKPPVAYCTQGIVGDMYINPSTGLRETKFAPVWLNFNSFDNCTPQNQLVFRAKKHGSPDAPSLDSLRFACDTGTFEVELWVYDTSGNYDFCVTEVVVQNNLGHPPCPTLGPQVAGKINISGGITTESGSKIPGVTVNVGGTSLTSKTNSGGSFEFRSLNTGQNYSLKPALDYAHLNGVSTFDLVIIGRHVLNITPITSPYKLIAADVNNSGAITTADMVELRKLILQIQTTLPQNKSWRFIEKSYVFPTLSNPFSPAFPEEYKVLNSSQDISNANFIGVKIGDLNGSADASFSAGAGDRTGDRILWLQANERTLAAGEEITVPVALNNTIDLLAIQFTLEFETENLEFTGVEKGDLRINPAEMFSVNRAEAGLLTASWFDMKAHRAARGEILFSLKFRVKRPGMLSDVISLNSGLTEALAYNGGEEAMKLGLDFMRNQFSDVGQDVVLYQNQPNPFSDETLIRFSLPEANAVKLSILDISGKAIKTVHGNFNEGEHGIAIRRSELPSSGLYFYRLEAAGKTVTRKMILMQQ